MWSWEHAVSWLDVGALTRRIAADQKGLRQKLWRTVVSEAANLPFAEQLLTAYYCAFDRRTPLYVKAVLVGAILYFIAPERMVPKVILLADDTALLAAAFKAVSSNIKPEHRQAAQRTLKRLRG
jgi:uncharacterized membrane protein YkvA (DUF1232 family)